MIEIYKTKSRLNPLFMMGIFDLKSSTVFGGMATRGYGREEMATTFCRFSARDLFKFDAGIGGGGGSSKSLYK